MAHGTHHARIRDSWQIDADFWTRVRKCDRVYRSAVLDRDRSWGYFLAPDASSSAICRIPRSVMFIPLGAMFFLMTGYLTGAAWNVLMRRIAENMMSPFRSGFCCLFRFCSVLHHLYEWAQPMLSRTTRF